MTEQTTATVTITADPSRFVAAMRQAALSLTEFDLRWRILAATFAGNGRRVHGLKKHRRDLRRYRARQRGDIR